jgi:hypothetical protein
LYYYVIVEVNKLVNAKDRRTAALGQLSNRVHHVIDTGYLYSRAAEKGYLIGNSYSPGCIKVILKKPERPPESLRLGKPATIRRPSA